MKKLDETKIIKKGILYRKIAPEDYYFLSYDSNYYFEDREAGFLANKAGYEIGDVVEVEILIKKKT